RPERGEHDAGSDRAVPGAAHVRGRGRGVRRPRRTDGASRAGRDARSDPRPGLRMSTRGREGWPDVVKGVCIILVVLWHVVVKHSSHLPWSEADGIPQLWTLVSAQLLPMRMPLFFLVSGMFAAGVVLAPGRTRLSERALRLGLLYGLWVV